MVNRKKSKYLIFLPLGLAIMTILASVETPLWGLNSADRTAMAETTQEQQPKRISTSSNIDGLFRRLLTTNSSTNGKKTQANITKSSIDRIIGIFRRQKKKGGTRTSSCIILSESVKDSLQTWSDRPLLVWEGAPTHVGIQSLSNKYVFWSHEVIENEQSIQYDGEVPLERGQDYLYWIQYKPLIGEEDHIGYQVHFKVMNRFEYQALKRDLSQKNLNTPSDTEAQIDLILERSQYFAQEGLFLDATRELFSVAERSPEIEPQLDALHCILSPE